MLGIRSFKLEKRAERVREASNKFLRDSGRPEVFAEPIFLNNEGQRTDSKHASSVRLTTSMFGSFIQIQVKKIGKPVVFYSGHLTIRTAEGIAEVLKRAGHFFSSIEVKQFKGI